MSGSSGRPYPGAGAGMLGIPAISLAEFLDGDADRRRRVACEVDDCCRSVGFLVIRDHGVPRQTIERAWRAARAFFDLPLETKLRARAGDPGNPRGYFPAESETLARTLDIDTPPDVKESFSSGPPTPPRGLADVDDFDFFYGPNIWPTEPASFRAAWSDYYAAMEQLGGRIMQLFAAALDLDVDYFAAFHSHHVSALRALNYPPVGETLRPGQRPAGEHSDYGSVTILKPDPDVAGLEVRMPSGTWRAAPRIDDGFLVNIGDMLMRWSNGQFRSTPHRVVNTSGRERYSFPMFVAANYDAIVACMDTCTSDEHPPQYPPTQQGLWTVNQITDAYEYRRSFRGHVPSAERAEAIG